MERTRGLDSTRTSPVPVDPRVRERATRGTRPTLFDPIGKVLVVAIVIALFATTVARGLPPIRWSAWTALGRASLGYGRFVLWQAIRYRPVTPPSDRVLPTVTVVVPAFNEGPMVQNARLSALESDYPADRLEIVAVDDGSTDDTWSYMRAVAAAVPERVRAIQQPKNGGKKEALRAGFLAARGEIVVTVDSDSRLAKDAIRHIVAPLVEDPEVGAVAGKVTVLNRYESLLTRFLAARFFVTFDLARAAQSRFGAVLCCPGALTAYRRAAVLEVLDRWSHQTFFGAPCTIGEDRALTTWLLRLGLRAVYQSTAHVETLVPPGIRGMTKMLVRWERGNVRESLLMLPVLFTPWRSRDRLWPTLDVILDLLQYPFILVTSALAVRHFVAEPIDLVRALATVAVVALIQALYTLRSERGTDFVWNVGYAALAFVGLAWIYPWSALTVTNGRWMTR